MLNHAKAGTAREDSYNTDASLSTQGIEYAKTMTQTLLKHRAEEVQAAIRMGGPDQRERPLLIWTSPRRRTTETAQFLAEKGYQIRQRSQMSQLNPGVCEKMSEEHIRQEFPEEVEKHEADPYHHRYPRAEVLMLRALLDGFGFDLLHSRTTIWLSVSLPLF